MIKYNNGIPNYWRDETSGKLAEAVTAYWKPYMDNQKTIPELTSEHIAALKMYIAHWAEAPCWKNNPYIDAQVLGQLQKAIDMANSIGSRKDISLTINELLELGIDPF